MSWFTSIRDAIESVASVAGNYVLPGSSLVTGQLVSEGAQEMLQSPVGQLANLGSGIVGGAAGNLSNYGTAWDTLTGAESGLDYVPSAEGALQRIGAGEATTPDPSTWSMISKQRC